MRRNIGIGIVILLSAALYYFLSTSFNIGGSTLPPLGSFMNPFTGFWQNAESVEDFTDINLDSDLVDRAVIVMDERLVPHIYASNREDIAYIQGYLHAKYRLWQMDMATRAISGRLSEVVGSKALEKDIIQRRLGMAHAAQVKEQVWKSCPNIWATLNAYTAGVNKYIENLKKEDYPIEFKLLDYKPSKWSNLRTAEMFVAMMDDLARRDDDLQTSNAKAHLGTELFDQLFPERYPHEKPVIRENKASYTPKSSDKHRDGAMLFPGQDDYEMPSEFLGSNNWAVGPQKTKSGHAILSNDPHLTLRLPSIWYELHAHTPSANLRGVSIPGIPMIIIGFSEKFAWGLTNVGHDLSDWYKMDWISDDFNQYRFTDTETGESDIRDITVVNDTIKVKGSPDHVEQIRWTVWGPVVYEKDHPRKGLAFHWMGHDSIPSCDLNSFADLWNAQNFEDFKTSASQYIMPAQNIVYADISGNIGLRISGHLPIKQNQQGRFVLDGSKSDQKWEGLIPQESMPYEYNPSRNYVVSANQISTKEDYPYYYHAGFDGYRARMIDSLLRSSSNFTAEDMKSIQHNVHNLRAEEAMAQLRPIMEQMSTENQEAFDALKNWNGDYNADDIIPTIFSLWYAKLHKLTFDEVKAKNLALPRVNDQVFINLLKNQEDVLFDVVNTPNKEKLPDLMKTAWSAIQPDIDSLTNIDKIAWTKNKGFNINHMANIGAFSKRNLHTGGDGHTINSMRKTIGPSWRMIVEMDPSGVKGQGIYPGGQSGNPGSKYYDHNVEPWLNKKYYQLDLAKHPEDVKESLFKIIMN